MSYLSAKAVPKSRQQCITSVNCDIQLISPAHFLYCNLTTTNQSKEHLTPVINVGVDCESPPPPHRSFCCSLSQRLEGKNAAEWEGGTCIGSNFQACSLLSVTKCTFKKMDAMKSSTCFVLPSCKLPHQFQRMSEYPS